MTLTPAAKETLEAALTDMYGGEGVALTFGRLKASEFILVDAVLREAERRELRPSPTRWVPGWLRKPSDPYPTAWPGFEPGADPVAVIVIRPAAPAGTPRLQAYRRARALPWWMRFVLFAVGAGVTYVTWMLVRDWLVTR